MPPCVRMRPSSTVMLPGPTCFQPVRSLPLNNGFQAGDCGRAAAIRKKAVMANRAVSVSGFRIVMTPPENEDRQERLSPPLETQCVQVVVTDFDVVKS